MPQHRNFRAWLFCDGDVLEEYKVMQDPEDEKVYTCWVASEAGKQFSLHWESFMKDVCDNRGVTYVDGIETHSYVSLATSNKEGASMGVKAGLQGIRPYIFSNTALTDDDAYLGVDQSPETSELGNITLKIYLVYTMNKFVSRSKRWRRVNAREIDLYDGAIHETTKKFCDHRITLGDAQPFGPPRSGFNRRKLIWKPIDRNDTSPHVIFRFKYRPRAYLQAQGIIPRPSADMPTPQKPIYINVDIPDQEAGQKRKRPLADQSTSEQNTIHAGPSGYATTSSLAHADVQPVFYQTPCAPVKPDLDDHVLKRSTSRQCQMSADENMPNADVANSRRVRAKREPISPVKVEGMRLWIDINGVVDLTMDD
ncbi:hypothetical protein DFH11DRAFT_363268 [Phellopilus nigrolimitatus]|nr:hypothetical protein DFH11DRAFT_363268 [Phellopilus nigrolimitatus]